MAHKFGDTPDLSQAALCITCRNSKIIQGPQLGHTITLCNDHPPVHITFPVVECTSYDDKRYPSLWDMKKIAYRFSVDDRKKTAGFLNPKEWKKVLAELGESEHED